MTPADYDKLCAYNAICRTITKKKAIQIDMLIIDELNGNKDVKEPQEDRKMQTETMTKKRKQTKNIKCQCEALICQ